MLYELLIFMANMIIRRSSITNLYFAHATCACQPDGKLSGSARGDYHACQLDGDLFLAVAYHIHACQLDGGVVEVRAKRLHACQPGGERSARKGRPPCPAPVSLTAERCIIFKYVLSFDKNKLNKIANE